MWLDYVKQKEEGKDSENFQGGSWMYETGKTEENPKAKGLALLINKNFTDYVENIQTESSHAKLNYTEKHHYKSCKSMPQQATTTTKQ